MKINSILKDHNYESIDSSLKVKYVVCFGNNRSQKRIELNPSLYKINSFTPKIRYKANDLRKEQFIISLLIFPLFFLIFQIIHILMKIWISSD